MSAKDEGYMLSEDDVSVLVEILTECNFKWEEIGIALRLPRSVIEQCRTTNNTISLTNILREWIQENGNKCVSLDRLKVALASETVGRPAIAHQLIPEFMEKNSDCILSEADILLLLEILVPVSHKWEIISLALGVPVHLREDIKIKTGDSVSALSQVLTEWVCRNGIQLPTLRQLRIALASNMVGYTMLAEDLILQFNKAKRNTSKLATTLNVLW